MAGDLIPPPSPAGKPPPDAGRDQPRREDEAHEFLSSLRTGEGGARPGAPAAGAPQEPAAAPRLPADSPYRSRFGFILGALIGVGIAAVIVVVALVSSGGSERGVSNWSDWHPTDDGLDGVAQIADHVGIKYRLENGTQLVAVQAGPLEVADLPLSIALRTSPTNGGDIQVIEGKKGVMYTLNGLGPRGSIASGKPTQERHLLLRREALELALYTFRYVDDVNLVVTLLPPKQPDEAAADSKSSSSSSSSSSTASEDEAGQTPTQALFFRPGDLEPQLDAPLRVTLPPKTPRAETLGGREAQLIDSLTRPNLFLASFQQSQDAEAFLVLDRVGLE